MWSVIKEYAEVIKIGFSLIAGAYVFYEYNSKQHDERIKRALDFQARWADGDVQTSRTKLDLAMFAQGKDATSSYDKIAVIVKDNKLQEQVLVVADYFGQLTTCLEKGLCDQETTCALFSNEVRGFSSTYRRIFKDWEEVWGRNVMAHPAATFKAQCEQKPAKSSCPFERLFSCGSGS